MSDQDRLINTQEALKILGVSIGTLQRYLAKRLIRPSKKISGKNFFERETIKNFTPPSTKRTSIPTQEKKDFDVVEMRDVIDKWKVATYDTGSADVQIGVYADKIKQLEIDMRGIPRDTTQFYGMRKRLIKYVIERRKLLIYLRETDLERYHKAMEFLSHKKNFNLC